MQEVKNLIVVNEAGALIPRRLFGQKDRILSELDQAGVFSLSDEEPHPAKPVRVEMPISRRGFHAGDALDRSTPQRVLRAMGRAGWRPTAEPRGERA